MRCLVFDAGPVISLTTNNLLWILKDLKKRYKGKFCIGEGVKRELVDKPLSTKKFKFEALQVLRYINEDTISLIGEKKTRKKAEELLNLANNCFRAKNNPLKILHYGEVDGLAACINLKADAFVIDERTTRLLIENPKRLAGILSHKLHTRISVDYTNLKKFKILTKDIKIIRSIELVTIAFELGLLKNYLANIPHPKENLLDSILWGVKLNGCSVSRSEISQIIKMEIKR